VSDSPVRVVVAEDHPLYLDGLVQAVRARSDFDLVAVCHDGQEALATIRKTDPDVALLDLRMPGLDGLGVLNAVSREGMSARVLFLSAHMDGETVYRALGAGATGYLSKDVGGGELCNAISAAARGETVLPPEALQGVAGQIRLRSTDDRPDLTPREHEVLSMTAAGGSVKQVADSLYLGQGTVKTHLQNIYKKLEVSDRAAAVAEAMRRGLIE
jgi:two-component system, NarL family, nitrate/nitrite response regulator NarL